MRLLDRYILRQFLLNWVIIAFVSFALVLMIDLVLDVDEFVLLARHRVEEGEAANFALGLLGAMIEWYYPFIVLLYGYMSGLLVVAAMGFTFAGLSRSGELSAMVTSGVSLLRIGAPVLVLGCLLSATALPIQEFVIPKLAFELSRAKNHMHEEGFKSFQVLFTPDRAGNLLSAGEFNPSAGRLTDVVVLIRGDGGETDGRITAPTAVWDAAAQAWQFTDGRLRNIRTARADVIQGNFEAASETATLPIAAYPTDLSPEVLMARRTAIFVRLLSLRELRQLSTAAVTDAADITRIMNSRFSLIVVNVLMLVVTLPQFLRKDRVPLVVQAARAALTSILFWAGAIVLMQASPQDLNPATAAWLPVALYLPLSAWLIAHLES